MAPRSAPGRATREAWENDLRKDVHAALGKLRKTSAGSPRHKAALADLNVAVARLNALILDHHVPKE
jgi:hypothetical protein